MIQKNYPSGFFLTEGPTLVTVFQVLVKKAGIQRIGGRIAGDRAG
jgi:hypothetical protein